MAKSPIYLLHHKLKWRVFQKIYKEVSKNDSGPTPQNYSKVLWEMLRDRKVYIWVDDGQPDDPLTIGVELPKGRKIEVIQNGENA